MAEHMMALPLWTRAQTAPSSNAPVILAIAGLMTGLSILAVMLRIWVRQVIIKATGKDDLLILCAMLTSLGAMVCFCGATANGGGHHIGEVGTGAQYERLQRWIYVMMIMMITGMSLVKISVGFFLLRFLGHTWTRAVIIGVQVFIAVSTLACEAPVIFECIPVSAIFAYTRPSAAKCVSINAFTAVGILNGSLNIFTDFAFVVIPIPLVVGLNMSKKTKVTVIGILSLGLCVCATAIVRVVIGAQFFDPDNEDYTWHFTSFLLNAAELNIGIIAACLPTLRPLLLSKSLEGSTFLTGNVPRTGTASSPRTQTTSAHWRGYLRQADKDIELEDLGNFCWDQSRLNHTVVCSDSRASGGSGSEDGIMHVGSGIMKKTEVIVRNST